MPVARVAFGHSSSGWLCLVVQAVLREVLRASEDDKRAFNSSSDGDGDTAMSAASGSGSGFGFGSSSSSRPSAGSQFGTAGLVARALMTQCHELAKIKKLTEEEGSIRSVFRPTWVPLLHGLTPVCCTLTQRRTTAASAR
jgi:hypothetical protein